MTVLRKIPALAAFVPFYITEVVLSNLRIAADILRPRPRIRPGIIEFRVESMSDLQLLVLTNLITMTPGTLTLDVSPDRGTLYIHAMYTGNRDSLEADIRKLEHRVRKAF